jgi:hypothetical protein
MLYIYFQTYQPKFLSPAELICLTPHRPCPRKIGITPAHFLPVGQFSVTGAFYTCRPDLVGFVNGLPLVVIELKKPGVPARAAFDENLMRYKQQIPAHDVET